MNITEDQLRRDFLDYLDQRFGPALTDLLDPPASARAGERVIYALFSGEEQPRGDVDQLNHEAMAEFSRLARQIARGVPGAAFHFTPATDSGLPFPRLVDIPGADALAMGDLRPYATSHEELPSADFNIAWLLGVIFGHSSKYLLYIDFTDQRLGAVYAAEYDDEDDFDVGRDLARQFATFIDWRDNLRAEIGRDKGVEWAKLVQTGSELRATIKTGNPRKKSWFNKGSQYEHRVLAGKK